MSFLSRIRANITGTIAKGDACPECGRVRAPLESHTKDCGFKRRPRRLMSARRVVINAKRSATASLVRAIRRRPDCMSSPVWRTLLALCLGYSPAAFSRSYKESLAPASLPPRSTTPYDVETVVRF